MAYLNNHKAPRSSGNVTAPKSSPAPKPNIAQPASTAPKPIPMVPLGSISAPSVVMPAQAKTPGTGFAARMAQAKAAKAGK